MTMSQTPLLLSRILGRGAQLDPNEEIVTLMANGTHRQTLKATWDRANNWQRPSKPMASKRVIGLPVLCGTTIAISSSIKRYRQWAQSCTH